MKKLIVSLAFLLIASSAAAAKKDLSYTLPITRDGKTIIRVASLGWSSEYPRPIINVLAGHKGYYHAKAYKSLRKLDQPLECDIIKGLYHPWSKTPNSAISYYSINTLWKERVLQSVKLDGTQLNAGQVITNIFYGSEGFCEGHEKQGTKTQVIVFECNKLDNKQNFQRLTPVDNFKEQWIYLKCRQGYNAFVQDISLLRQPDVKEGNVKEYGVVVP